MNLSIFFPIIVASIGLLFSDYSTARPKGNHKPYFKLESSAFKNGTAIPQKHTCEGDNISPALKWSGAPQKTVSYALIVEDPDAPGVEPRVHWIVYNIPATVEELPEDLARDKIPGVKFGITDNDSTAFYGSCPPKGRGKHHYHFKLYAVDTMINLPEGISKKKLIQALEGHIVGQAELIGVYERK